jgi:hypothetical protein
MQPSRERVSHTKIRAILCAIDADPVQVFDERHLKALDSSELKAFFRLLEKVSVASLRLRLVLDDGITEEDAS